MKKILMALVVAGMSLTAVAQTEDYPVRENSVQTNGFWDNWFVEGSLLGIHADGFKFGETTTYNATLGLGKWFTPDIALRGQFHLPFYKLNGVSYENGAPNAVAAYAQVMFNMSNLIGGYKADRKISFIPYIGFGRVFSGAHKLGVWSPFCLGLDVPYQFNENWAVSLEASIKQYNNIDANTGRNWMTGLNLNVIWNLPCCKQGFEASPDMAAIAAMHSAQLAGLNEALSAEQNENKNLKEQLAKKPKEVTVEKVVVLAAPQSVFFSFNSAKIASKKEILNLESLANMAKSNGSKLKVTGYADSATGVPAYNQQLSERRAKAVAKELVKMGVAEENIVVEGKGGVADVKPSSYNRRVIIEAL